MYSRCKSKKYEPRLNIKKVLINVKLWTEIVKAYLQQEMFMLSFFTVVMTADKVLKVFLELYSSIH